MPISSQSEEISSDRFVPSARGPGFVQTTWLTRRLLLEGDLAIYSDHARLQTNSRYHLATARNLSDLFDLRGTTGVSLAIISDSLGADALGLGAQTIRLEWSLARRLMLGKPQFMLEDFLYDEALEHKFVKSSLLVTIERICHPSANRGRDGGLFILPRGTNDTGVRTSYEDKGILNPLRVLPAGTSQTETHSCCAKLILAAEIECGSFMSAAKQLFGEEISLRAGDLWVGALETDSGFRCEESCLRLVTIRAASKLANLMGATRQRTEPTAQGAGFDTIGVLDHWANQGVAIDKPGGT